MLYGVDKLKTRPTDYSWADSWGSESRQALIFRRRQTQHKFSSSPLEAAVLGPVNGVQEAPQTAHGLAGDAGRSASNDFFAKARICGEMMGSLMGFFFMPDLTIAHLGRKSVSDLN